MDMRCVGLSVHIFLCVMFVIENSRMQRDIYLVTKHPGDVRLI